MTSKRSQWLLLVVLLILAAPALAAEPKFPPLTGRVVDSAGVLSTSTQTQLTDMLAAHERATGEQVVVVTLDSLQGYTIEDYGYQLGRYWGIGQKDKNTGALLIVAPKEHKVRIEVGYGLEGTLTDATSRTIIENDILPTFKRGDYNAGVLAGTASILKVMGGDETVQPSPESGPSADANDGSVSGWVVLLFVAIWLVVIIMRRRMGPTLGPRRYGYYGGGGGFSGGGFGSGGSFGSSGGFSGGGGSFGGGGASGSW